MGYSGVTLIGVVSSPRTCLSAREDLQVAESRTFGPITRQGLPRWKGVPEGVWAARLAGGSEGDRSPARLETVDENRR
jgi:hypothetical protein